MYRIDLNSDLGESFGAYTIGSDEQVLSYITSANVACGFHASDPLIMSKTVALAKAKQVQVGAHPGYPDLVGFGRRNLNVTPKELKAMVEYQLGALLGFCKANQIFLHHVKPHGAMYNMAGKNKELAKAICEAVYEVCPETVLLGLSGSEMIIEAEKSGIKTASEVFADRAYEADGSLVSRRKPGAVITDEEEVISRVITMVKEQKVKAVTGEWIPLKAESVCVHGDGEKALAFVSRLREAFEKEEVIVKAF